MLVEEGDLSLPLSLSPPPPLPLPLLVGSLCSGIVSTLSAAAIIHGINEDEEEEEEDADLEEKDSRGMPRNRLADSLEWPLMVL